MEPTEHDALDAYSRVVTTVAEALLPRVAAIRVSPRGRSGEAAGSAVVLSAEGHLLTNAHVVGNADTGEATFGDGSSARLEIVGRDPLTDLAVVRPTDRSSSRRSTATSTTSASAAWWSPSATLSGWPAA
jgi:S1-C subfamily serine protease